MSKPAKPGTDEQEVARLYGEPLFKLPPAESSKAPYKLGDHVTWTSQAAGCTRTKTGLIEEVLPPMIMPNRKRFERLYRSSGVGGPRDHVSYVVRVPTKSGRGVGSLYWPRASALQPSTT